MPWLKADNAINTAAHTRCFPSSRPRAKNPKATIDNARAMECENSPAIVEAMFPP